MSLVSHLADKNNISHSIAATQLDHLCKFQLTGVVVGESNATTLEGTGTTNIQIPISVESLHPDFAYCTGAVTNTQIADYAVSLEKLAPTAYTTNVTEGSNKLLTSGGAYSQLQKKNEPIANATYAVSAEHADGATVSNKLSSGLAGVSFVMQSTVAVRWSSSEVGVQEVLCSITVPAKATVLATWQCYSSENTLVDLYIDNTKISGISGHMVSGGIINNIPILFTNTSTHEMNMNFSAILKNYATFQGSQWSAGTLYGTAVVNLT